MIVIITTIFILLTSFIKPFFCLGAGFLYTYNLVSFIIFYIFSIKPYYFAFNNFVILCLIAVLTFFSILKFYMGLKKNKRVKDIEFESAMAFLKKSNIDRIFFIPLLPSDEAVYKTGKKVFWGCHGYGFKWAEPYFPVMKTKVEKAISDWNLGGIFLQKSYFPELFSKVDTQLLDNIFENEKYVILAVKNWKNYKTIPVWAQTEYCNI
jgi:hypothetical protein